MPSWPEKRTHIGSHAKRIDAPAKVTGAAKYSSDVQPQSWLYGMILRSKWPKAKVTKINLEPAAKMPGIKAAVLAREGERTVRYYGEELAAVAGTTKQACLDALHVIEVQAQELPFVVREEEAMQEGAPRVWDESPNLSKPSVKEQGEVVHEEIVAPQFRDPRQHHFLDRRGRHLLGFHSRHLQRPRWLHQKFESFPGPGARHLRIHGRGLRLEVRFRHRGWARRKVIQSCRRARETHAAAVR